MFGYNALKNQMTTNINKDLSLNLFVKNLTVIDASYLCQNRGLVGDSWILDVSLDGDLDEMSMILDFGRVKKQIKHLIDEHIDHSLIVPSRNSAISFKTDDTGYTTLHFERKEKSLHLRCPNAAYCFIDDDSITKESITAYVLQLLRDHLPKNVKGIEITLRHEDINGAFYHYSHGLKKHDGNCQRIAHGHRSPIELFVNGQRDVPREQVFAERWKDIYLGSKEDLVDVNTFALDSHACAITDDSHFGFRYVAPQGEFELAIAKSEAEIINTDTTVELLADFIANEIEITLKSSESLKVVAYEGVGKGAMAFR